MLFRLNYLDAYWDITGGKPTGSVQQRRLHGFHPAWHVSGCKRCSSAARIEDFCAAMRMHMGPGELRRSHGTVRLTERSEREEAALAFEEEERSLVEKLDQAE